MSQSTIFPPKTPLTTYNLLEPSVEDQIANACWRAGITQFPDNCQVVHHNVKPVIQSGPTCGLVALAMMFDQPTEEILKIAMEKKFTNNGEMFSCVDMETLTRSIADSLKLDVLITRKTGDLFSSETVKLLLDGAFMLVPYDSDFNYEPCLRRGHKAHWALIVGIVTVPGKMPSVLARQGKSARIMVWSLERLAMSNCNLVEMSPQRHADHLDYVVPPGGLEGDLGLCEQYIIVKFCNSRMC